MMRNVRTTMIASAIALSLGTGNVLADSWTIVQEATLSSNPTTLTQTTTTTGNSVQAINNINIDGDALGGSSQTVTTKKRLILIQNGNTTTAKQAVNRISAANVGTAGTAFTQSLMTRNGNIILNQSGAGIDNSQAVNDAVATTVVDLTQTLSPTGNSIIRLKQGIRNATGTGNVQAVNRVKATTVTKLNQTISGSNVTLKLNQANGVAGTIQAGNLIDASTAGDSLSGTADNVVQDIDIATLNMRQNRSGASIQAGNALITAASGSGAGHITQTFTVDSLGMIQSGANGSIQSGNYVGVKIN